MYFHVNHTSLKFVGQEICVFISTTTVVSFRISSAQQQLIISWMCIALYKTLVLMPGDKREIYNQIFWGNVLYHIDFSRYLI